ncbi:MAG: hypothetical protein AAFX09_12875 [Pseudomonadota bacterium]
MFDHEVLLVSGGEESSPPPSEPPAEEEVETILVTPGDGSWGGTCCAGFNFFTVRVSGGAILRAIGGADVYGIPAIQNADRITREQEAEEERRRRALEDLRLD